MGIGSGYLGFLPGGLGFFFLVGEVDLLELVADDGHGQGEEEYSEDQGEGADDLAWECFGDVIAIPDGGDGDDGPPNGLGDIGDVAVVAELLLDEVDEAADEDHA